MVGACNFAGFFWIFANLVWLFDDMNVVSICLWQEENREKRRLEARIFVFEGFGLLRVQR